MQGHDRPIVSTAPSRGMESAELPRTIGRAGTPVALAERQHSNTILRGRFRRSPAQPARRTACGVNSTSVTLSSQRLNSPEYRKEHATKLEHPPPREEVLADICCGSFPSVRRGHQGR